MDKETEKLLKVLDMTKDEQRVEIAKYLPNEKRTWSHLTRSQDHVGDMWICFKCGKRWNSYSARLQDKKCSIPSPYKGSLADLAFRLRGEVDYNLYVEALETVYEHWQKQGTVDEQMEKNLITFTCWLAVYITAIERIMAALIAKKMEKK